jgi:predicted DNA-binding protein (MmcQ/YjbR family)
MHIESFRTYCLNKKGVTECFPFDEEVLVFKVLDKMFALTNLKNPEFKIRLNVILIEQLRFVNLIIKSNLLII